MRIAVLVVVVVAVVVGVVLGLVLGNAKHHPKPTNGCGNNCTSQIGPKAETKTQLSAQALTLGQPMYWAGPMRGYHYEFWRLTNDRIFVRYLPVGVKAGDPRTHFLIVGTYPFPNAYARLKELAKGRGVSAHGAYVFVRPNDPRSVLIAWPHVDFEVEVYDPHPAKAAAVAQSGQVKTVG
jgi:hypothetical protein